MATQENQNQELCEEYRTVLRLFWEIPSIVIAIVSGILIGTYAWIPDQYRLLRVFLLFLSSLMVFIAFLSGWKHRSFGRCYIEALKDGIPRHTKKLKKWVDNWNKQQNLTGRQKEIKWRRPLGISVQKMFLVMLMDILGIFLILAFYELLISVNIMSANFSPTSILPNIVVAPIGAGVVIMVDILIYRYFD